jgi:putative lipoprotein
MRASIAIPVLLLGLLPRAAWADEWWGRDKALHFSVSIGLGSLGYGAAAPFTERRDYRALVGAGASLAIGGLKEGYDAMGYGDPSWRDFTWDVAGTAVGVLIAYTIDRIVSASGDHETATAQSAWAVAF